jgi:hypothetical protein
MEERHAEVPTVNIIMSYDYMDLLEFQKSMTLTDFKTGLGSKKTGTQQTYIFSNSPASNFISLKHKFGFSQGGKQAAAPELEIDFIDPEGTFETSWFKIGDQDLISLDDDPLGSRLERKKKELQGFVTLLHKIESGEMDEAIDRENDGSIKVLGMKFNDGATENNLEDHIDTLKDEVEVMEDAKKDAALGKSNFIGWRDSNDDGGYAEKNLELIQKQIDANSSQLQRPVWITYGIGENLLDWTPVMCFDRCINMEYSFTGGGARSLKLVYSGVGIHPNLTQMGLGPLKGFQLGMVFTGESNPMFNKKAFEVEKKFYEPLLKEVGSDYEPDLWRPSIHKIIRDTIRRYIKGAIGKNTNVLCILPDLDKYLAGEYKKRLKEVRASMEGMLQGAKEDNMEMITSHIQATKEVIESCGLNFVEELNTEIQVAVGANVWDRIENIEDPAKVMDWLQSKDLTAIISGDGVEETIQEKIKNVMEKIKECVDDEGAIPGFDPYWYVECDFNMLQVMYKHFGGRDIKAGKVPAPEWMYETNSVGEAMKPVVVVGDKNTIMSYLQARIFDQQQLDEEGNVMSFANTKEQQLALEESITEQINPYDKADGLTYKFLKEIYDVNIPIPWISPFGGSTGGDSEDLYLPGDTNIPKGDLDQIRKEQPLTALRMPVFALGTKNPNVLSLDIDINKQYYNLMNNFGMQPRSAQQYTTSIMGKGSEKSEEVTKIFNAIAELNLNVLDKNGVPVGFEAIVSPYWDQNMQIWGTTDAFKAAGEIDDLGGVETLFTHFGTDNDMPELVDPDGKDFDSKADMVKFMWKAFSAIGETHDIKPKAKKQTSGKGVSGGKNAIMTAAKMGAKLTNQALLGTITTIPMFHLSNDRRVINRKALLYCVEPRFAAGNSLFEEGTDNLKTNLTWFSGTYIMTGFEHTISKGAVQSSFAINRPTGGRE